MLDSECRIAPAFDPASPPAEHPAFQQFVAIWDTGATGSVITKAAADKLGIVPTGYTQAHGVNGEHTTATYLVNVALPGGVMFSALRVTEGNLVGQYDVLIGMDIIGSGDFAVTCANGSTVMTFRCPSAIEIDFVKDHNAEQLAEQQAEMRKAMVKSRPNAPRKKKKRR